MADDKPPQDADGASEEESGEDTTPVEHEHTVEPEVTVEVPQEELNAAILVAVKQTVTEFHRGPLPAPGVYKQYDEVLPGAAERILAMAEKALDHQISIDNKSQSDKNSEAKRGQYFALISTLVVISLATYMVSVGSPGSGVALATATIVGLVSAFHATRKKSSPEEGEDL